MRSQRGRIFDQDVPWRLRGGRLSTASASTVGGKPPLIGDLQVVAQSKPNTSDGLPRFDSVDRSSVAHGMDHVPTGHGAPIRTAELLIHERPEFAQPHGR